MRRQTLAFFLVALPTTVRAEPPRCASLDRDLTYQDSLFEGLDGDTGWIPASSPAQLRVWGRVAGDTGVAMGVHPTVCWNDGMKLSIPGREGAGLFDFAYGAEVHVLAGIHTSILGQAINWEGEIPLPAIFPTDLMVAGNKAFTPDASSSVSMGDSTYPVPIFSTDVLGDYIGITGLSGGLRITATATMTATYRTTAMRSGGLAIDGDTKLPSSTNTWGDALDLPLVASGTIDYTPSVTVAANFSVRILGYTVINTNLASYSMNLPGLHRDITLSTDAMHFPLPNARSLAGSKIDFGAGATQHLAIHNSGEAPLVIEAGTLPQGITAKGLTVPPGGDGDLVVTAADDALPTGSATLSLVTNDPDHPKVDVALGRDIGGTDQGEDDEDNGSHAGCDAGAGGAGLVLGLAALLAAPRRKRAR